jgi:hypothetical protein
MSATIIPFEPLRALRQALPTNPAGRFSDDDASLSELVGAFIELTPQVDASVAAVHRADADANRATMVRLGMDPGAPGAKGWANKDTEKDVFEKRMEVWRQVRDELGTDRINEESDELVKRHDAIFEKIMERPIRSLQDAVTVSLCSILVGATSHLFRGPKEDLDWDDRVVRQFIENLYLGFHGTPLAPAKQQRGS